MNAIKLQSNHIMTLEDLLDRVENDPELERQRKLNLRSSIRKFSVTVNGTLQLQASFPVFRDIIKKADIAAAGITPSRWGNIKSDLTFVLKRYGAATRAPLRKDLSVEWTAIMEMFAGVEPKFLRGISSLAHFANLYDIAPVEVNDATFDAFLDHLTHTTLKNRPDKTHQQATKLWNECSKRFPSWPGKKVSVPSYKKRVSYSWDEFPASFNEDISLYIQFMGTDDPTGQHCVGTPRKASTLTHHKKQIQRWASALVRDGYNIDAIVDLSVLVEAENFKRAVRYYHEVWLGGKKASLFEMASTMVVVAQEYVGIDGEDLEELKQIRNWLKCRERGMTDKNRERLRPFLASVNQVKFLCLGDKLIKVATKNGLSHRSALMIQKALLHEILIQAPMRFSNLVGLNLNRHIKRIKNGRSAKLFIVIPGEEVKNEEMLEFELPASTVRLFDLYINKYRPLLLNGTEEGWLFPGQVHGHKNEVTLRGQLCQIVKKQTGLIVNPHLYRHIAAFFYLQAHPGDYETVRKLLGHKSVETTMMSYAEFDGLAARRLYSEHILERKINLELKIGDQSIAKIR